MDAWWAVALAGAAGTGLGVGLVLGATVARWLRQMTKDDEM